MMSDQTPIPSPPEEEIVHAEIVMPTESPPPLLGGVRVIRRPPRIWPVFLVLMISVFVQIGAVGLAAVLGAVARVGMIESASDLQFAFREAVNAPEYVLTTAALTMAGFALLAGGATWMEGERLDERLRLFRPVASPSLLILSFIGILSLQLAFLAATQLQMFPDSELLEEIFSKVKAMGPVGRLTAILFIGVAPGICEEVLFRGYVQTGLTRRWGPWRGALVTAILFGAMHLNFLQGAFATLLGLYLGLLTERTGSVIPAMILHGTNNVLATVMAIGNWQLTFAQPEIVLGAAFAVMVITEYVVAAPLLRAGLNPLPTRPNS
ncbi:CPBP family intramembrane glutamic endopeptidase [Thermogutta sp.]|uniref:CPBP family intramembrane glutamic endopeptidase n=1 Tax=Thermogutta sp. TaxID=1962930 RepID=UPI00321FC90F